MKNLFLLIILFSFLFSCQNSKELPTGIPPKVMTDSVKIKGEFEYLQRKAVTLESRDLKKKTFPEKNKFEFAFELNSPRYIKIKIGNNIHPIYLEPGDSVMIGSKNDKDGISRIILSGKGSEESNFLLQQKYINQDQFKNREIYSLSQKDFTQRMEEFREVHKNHFIKHLRANEKMNSEFIANEKANLDYDWAIKKIDYQSNYQKVTKRPLLTDEKDYFNFMDEFDLNQEELYRNGKLRYHIMVNRYLYTYANSTNPAKGIEFLTELFNITFSKIKSDKIKKVRLGLPLNSYLAYDVAAGTEDLIERYKSLDPDGNMQKYIAKNYETATRLAKGNPAPKFSYPNVEGNEVSLESLKGKNVCFLIWSGSKPMNRNVKVSSFFEMAGKFQDNKDINFVSLFIGAKDILGEKYYRKNWLESLEENNYLGINLYSDEGQQTTIPILTEYNIRQIQHLPRLALIDTNGNILNRNILLSRDKTLEDYIIEIL